MTKELGMETHPGEEVVKEEKFPHNRKPLHRQVCGEFWNLRGQQNREKRKEEKQNKTEYMPNPNCQWRSSTDAHICHQPVGAGQGGVGCIISA